MIKTLFFYKQNSYTIYNLFRIFCLRYIYLHIYKCIPIVFDSIGFTLIHQKKYLICFVKTLITIMNFIITFILISNLI